MELYSLFLFASIIFFILTIYPFTFYPLSLFLIRVRPHPSRPRYSYPAQRPKIAILCCAHNEEKSLPPLLQDLRALRELDPSVTVHIYSDGSTDDTNDVLRSAQDFIHYVIHPTRLGKSAGMTTLLRQVDADIILFIDANIRLGKNTLTVLRSHFQDPAIGCVCGKLIYRNTQTSPTTQNGVLHWRFDQWLKQLESDTGSVIGASGALFAARAHLCRPIPSDIIDDFFTSLSILCDGARIKFAPDLVAFENFATSADDEFRRRIRISCRSVNCAIHLANRIRHLSPLNLYKFFARKILKWAAVFHLILSILFGLVSWHLAPQTIHWPIYLPLAGFAFLPIFLRCIPPFARIHNGVLLLLAVGIGVCQAVKGKRYETWTTPQSSR